MFVSSPAYLSLCLLVCLAPLSLSLRPSVYGQDMVCSSEVLLAERAAGVLEVLLRDRGRCGEPLGGLLRPALLQALQRASMEDQHMTTTTTTCEIHPRDNTPPAYSKHLLVTGHCRLHS